jgi:hypothetical protein
MREGWNKEASKRNRCKRVQTARKKDKTMASGHGWNREK